MCRPRPEHHHACPGEFALIELEQTSEDAMVAAFLRAELDASRYRESIAYALTAISRDRTLLDAPDLTNPQDCADRKSVLQIYRGYPTQMLFRGFPADCHWRRVLLGPGDFDSIRYANFPVLLKLSGGTRRISEGARNFSERPEDQPDMAHVTHVVAKVRDGQQFPPLILVQSPGGPVTLLEGHSRATAYAITGNTHNIEALVGCSNSMSSWWLY